MLRRNWQELLDEAVGQLGVPGAQLGVLSGRDRIVVCSGTLLAGGDEPVVESTAFHAGSIAKAMAGLVVLDAARAGKLALDVSSAEQGEGLWPETPRTLLSQTSGRPNVLPAAGEDLEEFVSRVADLPLIHRPGRFSYCNSGWSVLDLLLRRTTGRSFEDAAVNALGPTMTFGAPGGAAAGHVSIPGREPQPVADTDVVAASAAGGRWWATADQLLDFAALQIDGGDGVFHAEDVRAVRTPTAALPGSTVFDAWGLGWAVWDRGPHRAFGWAGYTEGQRAFLRCFPEQNAAVVLLTNSAGPLFGPPGGTAVFDRVLPHLLELLEVPPLIGPTYQAVPRPALELAGRYGPVTVAPGGPDGIELHAQAFGQPRPVDCVRLGGNTFAMRGGPPGSMPVAFDDDMLNVGPFALPRH
jgi:CubicO group peptidase (beta-lactamase class C family)